MLIKFLIRLSGKYKRELKQKLVQFAYSAHIVVVNTNMKTICLSISVLLLLGEYFSSAKIISDRQTCGKICFFVNW